MEHIIPEKLGGDLSTVTITCKKCNNKHGTELDAHIIQQLRSEDIFAGRSQSPVRTKISTGEGGYTADIFFSNSGEAKDQADFVLRNEEGQVISIVPIIESSIPLMREQAVALFKKGEFNINLSGDLGFRDLPSRVALLRMGYLLMFRNFGYGYVLAEPLYQVRKQIDDPMTEMDASFAALKMGAVEIPNVVALLTEPKNLRCFISILKLENEGVKRIVGVILPGLSVGEESIYGRWKLIDDWAEFNPSADLIAYDETNIVDSTRKLISLGVWLGRVEIRHE